MPYVLLAVVNALLLAGAIADPAGERPEKRSPKEALRVFNDLIGPWRATGTPEGTQREKQKGFWQESHQWAWKFKGEDAWLKVAIENGKYFTQGELHYLPDKDQFQHYLKTTAQETMTFIGGFKDHVLTLDRQDEKTQETQRLVLSLIHWNRFLYRYEVKPADKTLFAKVYQVGAVRDDVPYAGPGDSSPECIVTGGLGTIKVTYKGQTYYVCCSGCRDAFKDDPEKYIKEFEEKKKAKAK